MLADFHRIKGFYIKAFFWQNKVFFIVKIYTENRENYLYFSLITYKSRKYKKLILKE